MKNLHLVLLYAVQYYNIAYFLEALNGIDLNHTQKVFAKRIHFLINQIAKVGRMNHL